LSDIFTYATFAPDFDDDSASAVLPRKKLVFESAVVYKWSLKEMFSPSLGRFAPLFYSKCRMQDFIQPVKLGIVDILRER